MDWDIRGGRDYRAEDRVEDWCLWLAGTAAVIGIVASVVGLVVIRRSAGRLSGSYRLSIGMVLNLLAVLVVVFTFCTRAAEWAKCRVADLGAEERITQ